MCALSGACTQPELTEILVVADTDLEVPSQLERVRFRVLGPNGEERAAAADFAAGGARPAVLALVHRGGPLGPFLVEVLGERAGEVVVERTARVSFVPGEVLALPMHLLASCAEVTCGDDETCGEDGCRSRDISASELQPWSGEPPTLDPRMLDGGSDGGIDAGIDAALGSDAARETDAGVRRDSGAECELDADCDDRVSCTIDTCVSGVCASVPDASLCAPDEHACTIETCDARLGCVPQLEHSVCDDAVACTADRCDVALGCVSAPADAACDDGVACTVDRCEALVGCVSAPDDARCDDGVGCTRDDCDPALGCASVADDARCDDGISCTFDTCDVARDCTSSTTAASCPLGERCDTSARGCVMGATFTDVYAFLARDCVGACHDAGADGGLDLSSRALAYASLVGVVTACGAGSNTRVIPHDARRSLLWRKLTRVDLCGERMPPLGPPASASDIAIVESWIAAGALDN